MRINRNINPLMEAILYFCRRTNGNSVTNIMNRLEQQFSDKKNEIHSIVVPIIQFETKINSIIDADIDRIDFFFKQFEGVPASGSIGSSPASMLLFDSAYKSFDDIDSITSSLLKMQPEALRCKLCSPFSEYLHTTESDVMSFEKFWELTETCPFPDQTKWRIVDVCKHYREYLLELADILRPVMELISSNSEAFAHLLDLFECTYPDPILLPKQIQDMIGIDVSDFSSIELYPMIMDFNSASMLMPEKHGDPLILYMGVLMHLVCTNSLSVDPSDISRTLKALGDPSRLEMLCCIKNAPTYGQELSNRFNVSATTVYHHMNKLMIAGLVESKLDGNRVYFSMIKESVENLMQRLRILLLD